MKTIRKTDYYGQLILATLILLTLPVLFLYGFMIGLFIMGWWQLISASLNTHGFIHSGYKKQISRYWILCIADLALLFLSFWFGKIFNPDDMQVITWVAIAGAVVIACYYLRIYSRLIDLISLKDELAGLLKSK